MLSPQSDMSSDTEIPFTDTITGSAALTRSWYGSVRAVFGKPYMTLLPDLHDSKPHTQFAQPLTSLLGTIPSLRFATPARLQVLADATSRETVVAGEAVIGQGDASDDVFFIVDGSFEVLISHFGHTPDFIRELHAGGSFGELGVLYDVPRTATVRCIADGHILRMPGEAFLDALATGS